MCWNSWWTEPPEVGEGDSVDGYSMFFSTAEWYQLPTPFSQWYTKSWSIAALEVSELWGIEPNHALQVGVKTVLKFLCEY